MVSVSPLFYVASILSLPRSGCPTLFVDNCRSLLILNSPKLINSTRLIIMKGGTVLDSVCMHASLRACKIRLQWNINNLVSVLEDGAN